MHVRRLKAPIAAIGVITLTALTSYISNASSAETERRYFNGVYAPVLDEERLARIYAEADSSYIASIKEARDSFGDDPEAAAMSMTEDAQLIDIRDDGVHIKVDGRQQMLQNMKKSFTGKKTSGGIWIPEKSGGQTWGIYKNIKVSYHYSTFTKDDGSEWTRPVIVVAEHKDGKRWREWRFFPEDR